MATITLQIPFGIGTIQWSPNGTQRRAAWSLYIEMATRVTGVPDSGAGGVAADALASVHSLFPTTRKILHDAGPSVGSGPESVGGIAIAVLNRGLRPFVTKWRKRFVGDGERADEGPETDEEPAAVWDVGEFWAELAALQCALDQYVVQLRRAATARSWGVSWLAQLFGRGSHPGE